MPFYAGYDIGGTNARLQLFDDNAKVLTSRHRRIRDATTPAEIAGVMVMMLTDVCNEVGTDVADVDAVGIGLAGQLSVDGRTVQNAPNLGWRNVDFVDTYTQTLRGDHQQAAPEIRLVNDLNAMLRGEHLAGAVQGFDDVLAVYVGTGVGGAILADGRLINGADANAGEIGHSKVVVGGRLCGCGERGCVEAYAGGVHLEQQVAELLEDTGDERLEALRTDEGVDLAVADAMIEQHHQLGDIWEQATDFLAMVIANATTLLNPAALLVGGGVLENCPNFRSMTLQKTVPLVLEVARENLEVKRAEMGDAAAMLGAAELARWGE